MGVGISQQLIHDVNTAQVMSYRVFFGHPDATMNLNSTLRQLPRMPGHRQLDPVHIARSFFELGQSMAAAATPCSYFLPAPSYHVCGAVS